MSKEKLLTAEQMVDVIRRLVGDKHGGMTALARRCGVVPAYISDIVNGRRNPGPKITKALGFKQVTMYKAENSDDK